MPARLFALFDGDAGSALLLTAAVDRFQLDAGADPVPVFVAIEAALAAGQWVALAADYALGASFERGLASTSRVGRCCGPGCLPRLSGSTRRLSRLSLPSSWPRSPRSNGRRESPSLCLRRCGKHAAQVRQIGRWIADGDCYQINLTFPLTFRIYGHPLALYARLRARQPVRYGGYVEIGEEAILSFSPELFFERHGSRVRTRPMKGTAPRGNTPREDEGMLAALLSSAKERAENIMIVDLLRNDLGRLAQPGKVHVEALCEAEAYPTLWQMVSTVAAELPGTGLAELFGALFPCGSITGAPKIRAMQRIAELEDSPRGLYTGALGWLAPGGDCRFSVAIRTVEVDPGRCARLGVGSGIVADADPDREYAECLLKARFLTGFDPGFELLETLRLEAGRYPLLSLHLERLQASAHSLGFACPLQALSSALAAEALARPAGVFRVRLTLAHDGGHQVAASPLVEDKGTHWQVVLAAEALSATDYLLRHKTTARARYDRALAALAARPTVFDAIFVNTRGEVCEGARSNVFIERDGILLTPPPSCGLLPGVMRRQLLASGRAIEQVLRLDDLRLASALYVGNAVRGLIPVSLEL
jgi:para-aminobenzoate synthetase/4-amino-4-deoxychorismate lyase